MLTKTFQNYNLLRALITPLAVRNYTKWINLEPQGSSSPISKPYSVELITEQDHENVIKHLHDFFFQDEPLNRDVALYECIENNSCREIDQFSSKYMNQGHSLMALSSSGNVIGAALNVVDKRDEEPEDEAYECLENPSFYKILDLLDALDENADVFGKFPHVNSVMNTKILSVDSTWRTIGIGRQLVNKTMELARNQKLDMVRMDCTSFYSAQVAAKLGYKPIYTLKYNEYKVCGKTVFNPGPPHSDANVYVRKLEY